MSDEVKLVVWLRANGRGPTKVHVETPVHNDREGRTACGKRYARNREQAMLDPNGRMATGFCKSCDKALQGIH